MHPLHPTSKMVITYMDSLPSSPRPPIPLEQHTRYLCTSICKLVGLVMDVTSKILI